MSPLAQEPMQILGDPKKYLTCIHGEAGVGKTGWAAQIPEHYFMDYEHGTVGLNVYGQYIDTFEQHIEVCTELVKAAESGFRDQRPISTIVMDTYDRAFDLCGQHIMPKEKFIVGGRPVSGEKVEDIQFGLAYKRVTNILINHILKLKAAGFGIVLISHTRERLVKWRGQDIQKYSMNLSSASEETLVNACDAVGYFEIIERQEKKRDPVTGEDKVVSAKTERIQRWQPEFQRIAKHRLAGFPEILPLPIRQGWSIYEEAFTATLGRLKIEGGVNDGRVIVDNNGTGVTE